MSAWREFKKPAVWISTLLAVVSLVLAVYFWWEGRQRPAVAYRVSTVKVFDRDASADSIRVVDKDGTVLTDSVFVSEVSIWNSGSAEIDPEAVRLPLTLSAEPDTRLLDAQLIGETHGGVSGFKLKQPRGKNAAQLSWTYFDPGEGCRVRLIYAGTGKPAVQLSGVIYGVGDFNRIDLRSPNLLTLALYAAVTTLWAIYVTARVMRRLGAGRIGIVVVGGVCLIACGAVVIGYAYIVLGLPEPGM